MYNFIADSSLAKTRLDKALTTLMDLSRSKLGNIIRGGNVTINGKIVQDLDYLLHENDNITVVIPEVKPTHIKPTAIDINIVYEDDDIIIIDKQAGLTVHPGAGNYDDTLVNALVNHYGKELSKAGGLERPGIVHRLDRDTSGLMIIAKNDVSHVKLSDAIAKREVQRYYKAFVWGNIMPPEGTITTNIARSSSDRTRMRVVHPPLGKIATTHYTTLSSWQYVSLVECKLETGRTHQIRVHLSHVGHSVLGDQIYGNNSRKIAYYASGALKDVLQTLKRQALHSYKLEFEHPITGKNMSFVSELPEELERIIRVM